ncbi:MAG: ABC transporter permease [Candidatus Njordarchaeales archaeon]
MGIFWIKFSKQLDKLTDKLVDAYAAIRESISPGWKVKNRSKIEETKLMLRAFNRSPLGIFGAALVFLFFFLGIFGPLLAPEPYWELYVHPRNMPPGWEGHIFGTDYMGRDLLSSLLWGARVSLVIGILVVALGTPLGIILGLISAYYGGKVDEIIMRIVDIFYAFPALMLAIAMAAVLPSTISQFIFKYPLLEHILAALFAIRIEHSGNLGAMLAVILAMVIVWWPGYTRMVRAVALSEKEKVYVEAAKALGLSDLQIMFKHILPNVITIILVMVTIDLGSIIILEAALSFLGLGAQPPICEIGRIVSDGREYWPDKWWLVIIPGTFLFIVGLGWNLLGDVLRDVLDPRTRRSIEFGIKERPVKLFDIVGLIGDLAIVGGIVYMMVANGDVPGALLLTGPLLIIYMVWKGLNLIRLFDRLRIGQILGVLAYLGTYRILSPYMVGGGVIPAMIVLVGVILKMVREELAKRMGEE